MWPITYSLQQNQLLWVDVAWLTPLYWCSLFQLSTIKLTTSQLAISQPSFKKKLQVCILESRLSLLLRTDYVKYLSDITRSMVTTQIWKAGENSRKMSAHAAACMHLHPCCAWPLPLPTVSSVLSLPCGATHSAPTHPTVQQLGGTSFESPSLQASDCRSKERFLKWITINFCFYVSASLLQVIIIPLTGNSF